MARVTDRLARIADLITIDESTPSRDQKAGRNWLARTLDATFGFTRRYVPPLHFAGLTLTALFFYIYARLVALTARLVTSGAASWPDLPAPGVVALWHRDAPSLLVACYASSGRAGCDPDRR